MYALRQIAGVLPSFGDDVEDSRLRGPFCACAALIRGKNLIVCRIGVFCGNFSANSLKMRVAW